MPIRQVKLYYFLIISLLFNYQRMRYVMVQQRICIGPSNHEDQHQTSILISDMT